jgi:GNAT superfamily N-acetyltransferase
MGALRSSTRNCHPEQRKRAFRLAHLPELVVRSDCDPRFCSGTETTGDTHTYPTYSARNADMDEPLRDRHGQRQLVREEGRPASPSRAKRVPARPNAGGRVRRVYRARRYERLLWPGATEDWRGSLQGQPGARRSAHGDVSSRRSRCTAGPDRDDGRWPARMRVARGEATVNVSRKDPASNCIAGPIRFARIEDLHQLQEVHTTSRELFQSADRAELAKLPVVDAPTVWRSFEQGGLLVASADGRTVAGFGLSERLGGYLHVHQMSVRPALTGCGLGAALLNGLIQIARARADTGLTLITYRHVPWNMPFYARHGFAEHAVDTSPPHLKLLLASEEAVGVNISHRAIMVRMLAGAG